MKIFTLPAKYTFAVIVVSIGNISNAAMSPAQKVQFRTVFSAQSESFSTSAVPRPDMIGALMNRMCESAKNNLLEKMNSQCVSGGHISNVRMSDCIQKNDKMEVRGVGGVCRI